MSYFKNYLPYDEQKWTSKRNDKANEFEYNFLIICRYWDLVKNQRMISQQIENSEIVTTLKF